MQRILKHTQSKDLLLLIILYCLLDSMFLSIPCTSGILSFMNQMHIYIQAKRQRPEYFYLHLHTLKETVQCGKTISKSTHSETPHGALKATRFAAQENQLKINLWQDSCQFMCKYSFHLSDNPKPMIILSESKTGKMNWKQNWLLFKRSSCPVRLICLSVLHAYGQNWNSTCTWT